MKIFVTIFMIVWWTGFFYGMSLFHSQVGFSDYKSYAKDHADVVGIDYHGVLKENGDLYVTETLSYDIISPQGKMPYRELYREMFINEEDFKDGVDYSFPKSITEVAELNNDGTVKKQYDFVEYGGGSHPRDVETFTLVNMEAKKGKFLEMRWYLSSTLGRSSKPTFRITYIFKNVLRKYNDATELNLMLFTGGATGYIKDYKATIEFPDGAIDNSTKIYTHNQPEMVSNISENTVTIECSRLQGVVNMDEGFVEIVTLMGKNSLNVFAQSQRPISNKETYDSIVNQEIKWARQYENYPNRVLGFTIMDATLAVIFIGVGVWWAIYNYKLNNMYRPKVTSKYYREIPSDDEPVIANYLLSERKFVNYNATAGTLMSLCNKGVIEFSKINSDKPYKTNNIQMTLVTDSKSKKNLKQYEKVLLAYLVEAGLSTKQPLTFKQLQTYANTSYSANRALKSQYKKISKPTKYYEDTNSTKRQALSFVIGLAVSALLTVLGGLFLPTMYGRVIIAPMVLAWMVFIVNLNFFKTKRLSKIGAEESEKWLGLYNFLNELTLMSEQEIQAIKKWDDYLVYATSFGISDKVIKVLETKFPDAMDNQFLGRYGGSYSAFRAFSSSVSSGARTSLGSSGSGSRGGSSSGGGGRGSGGGGGGGRR